MSQLLEELLKQAEQLSPEEQVQLIERLANRVKIQQQNKAMELLFLGNRWL
jgi:hypothetical protein